MEHTPALSTQLRDRRQRLGLSLAELARRAGTSVTALSRYENGWDRFEVYTLRKLATALGCRLSVRLAPVEPPTETVGAAQVARQLRRLFWDRRLRERDLHEHAVWVLERVLEYGSLADVRAMQGLMGREKFLDAVSQVRFQSVKTQRFWEHMLAFEGRSCTRKYSGDTAWPC